MGEGHLNLQAGQKARLAPRPSARGKRRHDDALSEASTPTSFPSCLHAYSSTKPNPTVAVFSRAV